MIEVSPTFRYVQNYLLTLHYHSFEKTAQSVCLSFTDFHEYITFQGIILHPFKSQLLKISRIAMACFVNISMITRAEKVYFRGTSVTFAPQ